MNRKEVRDSNGKLVCVIDTQANAIEIKRGNVTTIIEADSKGNLSVKEKK